jgi:hypothetical protein
MINSTGNPINRRCFIKNSALIVSAVATSLPSCNVSRRSFTFLVVSGWQTANIGDITHTPGILSLLYGYFPGSKCILWPKNINQAVERMLLNNFPELEIIYYDPADEDSGDPEKLNYILESSDMLIHSSGPGVIGIDQVIYWKEKTSKPFGMIGVTLSGIGDKLKEVLQEAAFIYTRETASLTRLRTENILRPVTGFAPDSTFAIQLDDEKGAGYFLANHRLKEKEFICIIPRLRYTPYHEIYPGIGWSDEKIREVTETNDRHKEEDHAKVRELIVWWVSETGNKVLLCPEMTYQVNIMDPLILDLLTPEIRKNVVKHDYWLPDEAASVYKKAHSVISMECHSPIIAAANGTPCFYLRQPQDTVKGQMWYDIGLDDWVFEIEDTTGKDIIRQLNQVYTNYSDALNYLKNAMNKVSELYDGAFEKVQQIVYLVK